MNKTIETKFGTAKIHNGYYRITSHKEGNHDKLLHRLIFADYWQIDDIDDFFGEKMHIHHIDGNKINNELWNLEPIPRAEHISLHKKGKNHPMYGKHHTEESKQKMRENHADYIGVNHPMYGKHHTEETKNKISEKLKGRTFSEESKQKMRGNHADFTGVNHPKAKYNKLWDINFVYYDKSDMFKNNPEGLRPRKCFKLKYKGKPIPIGAFHDFTSIEIINDLIKKEELI